VENERSLIERFKRLISSSLSLKYNIYYDWTYQKTVARGDRRVMWSNWHRNKNDISTAALDLVRSATTSILVSASYIRC